MALTANAARERAEEWLQHVQKQEWLQTVQKQALAVQKQARALLDADDGIVKTATTFISDTRDEMERRVEEAVGRILGALQIVTTSDVAELDAKLKTISKRLDQIEQRSAKKTRDS